MTREQAKSYLAFPSAIIAAATIAFVLLNSVFATDKDVEAAVRETSTIRTELNAIKRIGCASLDEKQKQLVEVCP
jgi:hypothetical protein